jgi:hypothetical protein
MDKLFTEALGDALYQNTLNEVSMADDIAKWEPLIFPLIHKIYPESLVEQIASVQPTKSPRAKITYLNAIYTGDKSNIENDVHWTNSRLLTLAASASSSVTAGGTYLVNTTPNIYLTVYYGEMKQEFVTYESSAGLSQTQSVSSVDKYWNILAACVTGSLGFDTTTLGTLNPIGAVIAGNTIGGETILYTTTNKNTIKKVFKNYSKVLETNSDLREINFEPATKTIETISRKIRSKFSQEKLQDLLALYKEKAYDIVAEAISNEIRQEVDREIIEYLKLIATPMQSDIVLPLSIGMGSSLGDLTYDLFGSIFLAAEEIVKATKRNRTMFVLADSATCAFLLLNPIHTQASPEESNPYYVGKIGAYDLYCDPFSIDHYVVIGYKHKSKEKHDSGLFFCPYTTTIHELTSGDTANDVIPFSQNFMVMNRYGFTQHPQDSGTGDGDSDFFRIFSVNYYDPNVIVPNFPEQFRTEF